MQRAWADLPKPFPLCAPLPRSLSKRQDGCGFGSGRGPLRLLRLVEILAPAGADVEAAVHVVEVVVGGSDELQGI